MCPARLPDGVTTHPSSSGAEELRAATEACTLRLDLQGAHLLSWMPAGGEDLLWLSPEAVRAPGRAIRGGIPLCAPWFAGGPDGEHTPSHGPARTQPWQLREAHVEPDGTVDLTLATTADGVDLTLALSAGATQLHLELTTALPADAEPRRVEAALHTYLAVHDVRATSVTGLAGSVVVDKNARSVGEAGETLRPDGPTDLIHRTAGPVTLEDGERSVRLETQGAADTVVWTPWAEGAAGMTDVPDDGWHRFLCVETACIGPRRDEVDHSIALEPGGSHALAVTFTPSDAGGAA